MKDFSIIRCYSPLPTDEQGTSLKFGEVLSKYKPGFQTTDVINPSMSDKVFGWSSYSQQNNLMVLFLFIDPKSNLDLMIYAYDKLKEFDQHGFSFNTSNFNVYATDVELLTEKTPDHEEVIFQPLGTTIFL